MSEERAYLLASELESQHRKFFRYTGWVMVGGGLLVAWAGAMFLRASARKSPYSNWS